ncbi:Na+/proline symporter [Dehalococcoidia bacterium]|nr:Na+/proline symporter [Dehalococcoidia bacterium]
MIDSQIAIIITVITATFFLTTGVFGVRRRMKGIEDFLVARNSAGVKVSTATLVASVIGAWVLLSPAETGTWAGIVALVGYGIGQAAPLIVFICVGPRMRLMMPAGHSLTEYVWHRYGRVMYGFSLVVMIFYMFVFMSAELTGISQAVRLLSDTPLWLPAMIVGLLTVAYTAYGGIRASIFTDTIQFGFILPLLLISFIAAVVSMGGFGSALAPVRQEDPQLLSFTHSPGIEFGLTLVIAVFAANMFHQGFWQRVYTAKNDRTLRIGFGVAGAVVIPVILLAGVLGIMAVGQDVVKDPSVALFSLVNAVMPTWAVLGVLILALVLVMSSLDTLLNGITSIITTDLARFKPDLGGVKLMQSSRLITIMLIVPAIFIASRGWSVLYLFLIADLVCSAAVFPVLWGFYSNRFTGNAALASSLAGLVVGALFFPKSDFSPWLPDIFWAGKFLASFGFALGISVASCLVLTTALRILKRESVFDYLQLRERVSLIDGSD